VQIEGPHGAGSGKSSTVVAVKSVPRREAPQAHEVGSAPAGDPLVRFLLEQSCRAAAGLLKASRGPMLKAALKVLRDWHRAEDVVEDVYLEVVAGKWTPEDVHTSGVAFLVARVRSLALTRKRSQTRTEEREEDAALKEAMRVPPWAELAEVREALNELSGAPRRCIELVYFEEKSLSEAAAILGRSRCYVKRQLQKGLRILRLRLSAPALAAFAALLSREHSRGGSAWALGREGRRRLLDLTNARRVPLFPAAAAAILVFAVIAAGMLPFALEVPERTAAPPPALARGGRSSDALEQEAGRALASAPAGLPEPPVRARRDAASSPRRGRSAATTAAPETETSGATRLEVEVRDQFGALIEEGTVRFELEGRRPMTEALSSELAALAERLFHERPLAAGNPFAIEDIPLAFTGRELALEISFPFESDTVEKRFHAFELQPGLTSKVEIVLVATPPLEVVVRDALSGKPIAGARVAPSDSASSLLPAWASTGGGGRLSLLGIGRERLRLDAEAEGYLPAHGVEASRKERAEEDGSAVVIRLQPIRGGTSGSARILVLGPDGEPWGGIAVERVGAGAGETVATGRDGTCRFSGLPRGEHRFRAEGVLERGAVAVAPHLRQDFRLEGTLRLEAGEERLLVLGFLGGTASLFLELRDREGEPAEGSEVLLRGVHETRRAPIGERGEALLEELAAGEYELTVAGWRFAAGYIKLKGGAESRLRLRLGEAIVHGRVLQEPGGEPAAGVDVLVEGSWSRSARSDAQGRFRLHDAPPGEYQIRVGGEKERSRARPVTITVPESGMAEEVELILEEGGAGE
jgi:RNA polymerase sigma-70 factor (ECF subfamily)